MKMIEFEATYRSAGLLVLLAAVALISNRCLSTVSSDSQESHIEASQASVHLRLSSAPTSQTKKQTFLGEEFSWSEKLQDWALRRAHSNEAPLEARDAPSEPPCIWPEEINCSGDRIINQIRLKPQFSEQQQQQQQHYVYKIAIVGDFDHSDGRQPFSECNFNKCELTRNLYEAQTIIFKDSDVAVLKQWPRLEQHQVRSKQIWVAYLLESPPNTFDRRFVRAHRDGRRPFNWTASYRSNSDIVTPYSKFVPYEDTLQKYLDLKSSLDQHEWPTQDKGRELVGKKQGKVAWFVSNCHAHNGRLEYAHELAKHIQVDIYGKCGNFTCSKWTEAKCLEHINREYKFYLAFENSNNRDYITEKLYRNAFGYNNHEHALLPIVMGPPRSDYERLAPPHSFVHVDDFESPRELASFLIELHANHAAYLAYFRWKSLGRFIDTNFLCRVCALVHTSREQGRIKIYDNLKDWWLED